jgi:hypothetical protein
VAVLFMIALAAAALEVIIRHRIRLDGFDGLAAIDHPTGWFAVTQGLFGIVGICLLVCAVAEAVPRRPRCW